MDRKRVLATGGAAAAAAAVPAAALADAGGSADQGLVGSWFGSVSANGNPLPGFDDVISFLAGGVVIESRRYELNPPPPFPPLFETTGHGAWTRTGNRTYEAFFRFLLQDQASGGALGTDNVRLTLTLSGDSLDGTFHSEVKTPDGTVVDSFDGTWHGERITV